MSDKFQPKENPDNPLPSFTSISNVQIDEEDINAAADAYRKQMKGNEFKDLIDAIEDDLEGDDDG